ncbi:MAG: sigma-54 dependent transcriptional regulator [bacterium]
MRIIIVDDEEKYVHLVGENLKDAGHDTACFTSGAVAVAALSPGDFDLVITDLKMAPVDGMAVLEAARRANPDAAVIVMTAYGTIPDAVRAMRAGAYDFITKPFVMDELSLLVERAGERGALRRENTALKAELCAVDRMAEMVGSSPALEAVRALIAKVALSDATVLVLGESGVGKELVARLIHRQSRRGARPFAVVHAAALPDTLLESELFGYEKGAFTGAVGRKAGLLEQAEGGTLLLDEIGEISAALQVKLLRFLQEKTFTRLGGHATVRVDARVVCATNRNLLEEVQQGRFREDLYYRLSVFPITVPPLRERAGDIAPLARHVLERLGYRRELGQETVRLLERHDWPGNVRELENVLERALILAGGEEIAPRHIQLPEPVLARPEAGAGGAALYDVERSMVEDALRKAAGNKSKAAKLLGITRRMLYTKLRNYGIDAGEDSEPV